MVCAAFLSSRLPICDDTTQTFIILNPRHCQELIHFLCLVLHRDGWLKPRREPAPTLFFQSVLHTVYLLEGRGPCTQRNWAPKYWFRKVITQHSFLCLQPLPSLPNKSPKTFTNPPFITRHCSSGFASVTALLHVATAYPFLSNGSHRKLFPSYLQNPTPQWHTEHTRSIPRLPYQLLPDSFTPPGSYLSFLHLKPTLLPGMLVPQWGQLFILPRSTTADLPCLFFTPYPSFWFFYPGELLLSAPSLFIIFVPLNISSIWAEISCFLCDLGPLYILKWPLILTKWISAPKASNIQC